MDQNLNRKTTSFIPLDSFDIQGFPVLSEDDLYRISLGTYQIKQVKSYYGEHMATNGRFIFQVSRNITATNIERYGIFVEDPILIKARIQSRHVNRNKYYVYLLSNRNGEGTEAIAEYYCTCKNGCRTVGCCAHVMTIIWFLGYKRHLPQTPTSAYPYDSFFLQLQNSDFEDD